MFYVCKEDVKGFSSPPKGKRIVFLGNSITYSGQYITQIESYFRLKYPQCKLEFINVGLSSETVSGLSEPGHADGSFPRPDLHDRLARVLSLTQPDLVFACYGINDGIYMPFDEARFLKFQDGVNRLHQQVTASGAEIVHLTPAVYDELRGGIKGYDDVLDKYSEWLVDQGDQKDWEIVDVHGPMKHHLQKQRNTNPSYYFSTDGVHPNDVGHWLMAQQVLVFLGEGEVKDAPDLRSNFKEGSKVDRTVELVGKKQKIIRNAWLSAIGHKRPGIQEGLPLEEAKKIASEIDKKISLLVGQTSHPK
jgi:lysophospholipase L1-like esterase